MRSFGPLDARPSLTATFAVIGLVGAWFVANACHVAVDDHRLRLPLLASTAVFASLLGPILAAASKAKLRDRAAAVLIGTVVAGMANGLVLGIVGALESPYMHEG